MLFFLLSVALQIAPEPDSLSLETEHYKITGPRTVSIPSDGFKLSAVDRRSGQEAQLAISQEVERIEGFHAFENFLAVRAEIRRVSVIILIDLETKQQVDAIYCYNPRFSANAQYVVYQKFYPRFGMQQTRSDLVLVYDLDRSPVENRVERSWKDLYDKWQTAGGKSLDIALGTNVGQILYPETNQRQHTYKVWIEDEDERIIIDGLTLRWKADGEVIEFTEIQAGKSRQVEVGLSEASRKPGAR